MAVQSRFNAASVLREGQVVALVSGWLDALDATGRWALLKLVTGGLRVGVSARIAKLALAERCQYGGFALSLRWVALHALRLSARTLASLQQPA